MHRGSDWNYYTYVYEETRRATVRFDVERAILPNPDTHGTCVRVMVRNAPGREAFDARLPEVLSGVDCMLVGGLTYADVEEWVFQVEHTTAFAARRPKLRRAAEGKVAFSESQGWAYFSDRVAPNEADWQRISDREMVERAVASGADPARAHDVFHHFVGKPQALTEIRDTLVRAGFAVEEASTDRLVLARPERLKAEQISAATVALRNYSKSLGAVYDRCLLGEPC